MNYFKGRTDVYAQKFYSKKHQRYEYAFVCNNKFIKGVCPIGQKKCTSDCQHFRPTPLTHNIFLNHLTKENSVIEMYPLLTDNTCYFLVIDFDKDEWLDYQSDALKSFAINRCEGILEYQRNVL